jgi:hypothetical protein
MIKGAAIFSAQEVNGSPTSDVTSNSGIYNIVASAATRDSPSCTRVCASLKTKRRFDVGGLHRAGLWNSANTYRSLADKPRRLQAALRAGIWFGRKI